MSGEPSYHKGLWQCQHCGFQYLWAVRQPAGARPLPCPRPTCGAVCLPGPLRPCSERDYLRITQGFPVDPQPDVPLWRPWA